MDHKGLRATEAHLGALATQPNQKMDKRKAKMSKYEDPDNKSTHSLDSELEGLHALIM